MLKKYSPLVFLVLTLACGADPNDSTTVTPTDTISSTATVKFNADGETLTVLETGKDPQSELFEVCTFSMGPITGTLEYTLIDNDTLKLGTGTFGYKRPLTRPETQTGVDDLVFSVWGTDETVKSGVTLALELEIEPDQLTFRMTCNG